MRDYKELVSELREMSEWVGPDNFELPITLYDKLVEAAEAIEELSKPGWIPVTDRLPGTGEIVLVYGKRGGIYTAEHNRNARWPGSFWKLNGKSHHCEPTHWMPLPEPPKEDDNA